MEIHLIEEESLRNKDSEYFEGVGCWSPLFPARIDDMVIAGSVFMKILEEVVADFQKDELIVFKKQGSSKFNGFKRVK